MQYLDISLCKYKEFFFIHPLKISKIQLKFFCCTNSIPSRCSLKTIRSPESFSSLSSLSSLNSLSLSILLVPSVSQFSQFSHSLNSLCLRLSKITTSSLNRSHCHKSLCPLHSHCGASEFCQCLNSFQ